MSVKELVGEFRGFFKIEKRILVDCLNCLELKITITFYQNMERYLKKDELKFYNFLNLKITLSIYTTFGYTLP